jgi:hypothetical protein
MAKNWHWSEPTNHKKKDKRAAIEQRRRLIELQVQYLGQWKTPWWEDGMDKGPKTRAGFLATTQFNRHDFGVSWNGALDQGGLVVGDDVAVTVDAEAILEP